MIASALIGALALIGADAGYHWPLDLPPALTSSFAEYRPGRFHAGVDLRTGGIGQPVRAIADGYVSRVRCSPWGYGKAVYLQLDDGNTVVYGHLDDYYDELRTYVQAAQHRSQDYTVDLYPEAGQFRVTRGQIVAKSGQTGIGAPHLHFELRDAASRPINPRTMGMTWPDTSRPEMRRLTVVPLTPESRVQGDLMPYVVDVVHQGNGRYTAPDIRARGPVAIGVDLRDPGAGGYNLQVHTLVLKTGAEGREHFRVQHDRVSYDNHRNGVVSYYPYLMDRGRFLMLWRWPGNTCDLYQYSTTDGAVTAGQSAVPLTIDAADFFGNSATLSLTLTPDAAPVLADSAASPGTGTGTASLECDGPMLVTSVQFSAPEPLAPQGTVDGTTPLTFTRINERTWRAAWMPTASGTRSLHVTHPNMTAYTRDLAAFVRGQAGNAVFGDARISVPANAAYGTLYAQIYPLAEAPSTPMRALTAAWRVWPTAMPLDEEVTLAFPAPTGVENWDRVHLYRQSGSGWSRESTRREGNMLTLTTRRFGTYCAMEDTTAPLIAEVAPVEGYQAQTRRPHIRATVDDYGSGVSDIQVTCAGKWLLVAYDPERKRIEWDRDQDLPSGHQEVVFRVTDAAGNTKVVTRNVIVP